jgi:hypothetical protein
MEDTHKDDGLDDWTISSASSKASPTSAQQACYACFGAHPPSSATPTHAYRAQRLPRMLTGLSDSHACLQGSATPTHALQGAIEKMKKNAVEST